MLTTYFDMDYVLYAGEDGALDVEYSQKDCGFWMRVAKRGMSTGESGRMSASSLPPVKCTCGYTR